MADHPAQRGPTANEVAQRENSACATLVPGQERSLAEYEALISAAGLRRTVVLPASSAQSMIEAVAASTSLGPNESTSTDE